MRSPQADTTAHGDPKKNTATPADKTGEIDHKSTAKLISFFNLLDRWDREVGRDGKIM